ELGTTLTALPKDWEQHLRQAASSAEVIHQRPASSESSEVNKQIAVIRQKLSHNFRQQVRKVGHARLVRELSGRLAGGIPIQVTEELIQDVFDLACASVT